MSKKLDVRLIRMLSRRQLLAVSLVPALAVTSAAVASPMKIAAQVESQSGGAFDFDASLAFARLASVLDVPLVPQPVLDQILRMQLGARDLWHSATNKLLAMAESAEGGAPRVDLTVLTTSPIASMRPDESSGFGWRDDPLRHDRRFHRGTDFRAKPGTPVLAAGDGVVVFAGQQSGYGNVIYVDHGGGVVTRYAHLSKIEAKKSLAITAGTEIGKVGMTGRTTGPHLHFEIRLDGNAVDPVLGMSVATLERESPDAGRIAAFSLAPELQAKKLDGEDNSNRAHRGVAKVPSRPERAGRVKRSQVLW
jgi:murein DD-endopeptidase MepM/ murein hydrolase activator NlpD